MKHLETYSHRFLRFVAGDYVIPEGENPKNSYSVIDEVRGGNTGDYMLSTYNKDTGKQLEHFPIYDKEIIRKMTEEEVNDILYLKTKQYNI